MEQKHHCQVLWAKNKYLVLSRSSNIYKEIREYLKQDQVEVSLSGRSIPGVGPGAGDVGVWESSLGARVSSIDLLVALNLVSSDSGSAQGASGFP